MGSRRSWRLEQMAVENRLGAGHFFGSRSPPAPSQRRGGGPDLGLVLRGIDGHGDRTDAGRGESVSPGARARPSAAREGGARWPRRGGAPAGPRRGERASSPLRSRSVKSGAGKARRARRRSAARAAAGRGRRRTAGAAAPSGMAPQGSLPSSTRTRWSRGMSVSVWIAAARPRRRHLDDAPAGAQPEQQLLRVLGEEPGARLHDPCPRDPCPSPPSPARPPRRDCSSSRPGARRSVAPRSGSRSGRGEAAARSVAPTGPRPGRRRRRSRRHEKDRPSWSTSRPAAPETSSNPPLAVVAQEHVALVLGLGTGARQDPVDRAPAVVVGRAGCRFRGDWATTWRQKKLSSRGTAPRSSARVNMPFAT